MTDPAVLRHVAVVSVSPGAFAQIKLHATPPLMVLTLRDIVAAVDRCRGMHTLLVHTTDGQFWAQIDAHVFLDKACTVLSLPSSIPLPARLMVALGDMRLASATIELPALSSPPSLADSVPAVRTWRAPHPYSFSSALFWPTPAVHPLADDLFASPAMGALIDAVRQATPPQALPVLPINSPATLHAALLRCPFLFFFLAALCNSRVRSRWLTTRHLVGSPQLWAYVMHTLLLRCIDVFWPTDAVAAHGMTGVPGVRVIALPAPRIFCLQPKPIATQATPLITEGTTHSMLSAAAAPPIEVPHPMALDATFPQTFRVTDPCGWQRLDSAPLALAASRHAEGPPSQVVYHSTDRVWFLVAETALDDFIASQPPHTLLVPIESRRVCRRLGFFRENQPLPDGARVLATQVWCKEIGTPVVAGLRMTLVDLAPGEYVDSVHRLSKEHTPTRWWPLMSSQFLLHPLRSTHRDVWANGHWWQCSRPGPSVCLDPDPPVEEVRAVLALQARHAQPSSAPATGLWLCTPPVHASFPSPAPRWYHCRLGCTKCNISNAVAFSGDGALLCRQELACVLWWHWQRFAEHMLCYSERAEELGTRWFQSECWALSEVMAAPAPPASPPPPPSVQRPTPLPVLRLSGTGGGGRASCKVTLRDGSTWDVNPVVKQCAGELDPLVAQVVYLLWCINDNTAYDYSSWVRIGMALHQLDPESTTLRHAWQWWSRKYGSDKYHEDTDFTADNAKWDKLSSGARAGADLSTCLLALAAQAKRSCGGTLTYERTQVAKALAEFWEDGHQWWAPVNSA